MNKDDEETPEPALQPAPRGERAVTRADLADVLYRQIGLSRQEAASLLEALLEEIASALCRGEPVLLSSFGSFSVRQKKQRMGRNPKTGKEVPILPRKVLAFQASRMLKARMLVAWGIPK
jgi:integration host factor subunit alpha